MLRILREGQRWLTGLVVIGVGLVFAVFLGLQGPLNLSSTTTIVKVGPYEFGRVEFERVRANREAAVQRELGQQFDSRALSDTLDNLAARELMETALLALAAEEMGLTVSKREIERLVLADPGFRDENGRFDRKRFDDFAEYAYGTQSAFMEERRLALLSLKMLRLLNGQPEVSPGEAREAVRRQLEEVRLAYVAFEGAADPEAPVDAAAVATALETRAEEIAALYAERGAEYNRPERVRARHILRSLGRDAPAEEVERVRAEIDAAAERLAAGESFEALAAELSQDPGSQARGGDLGFFARGQMVPDFEEVAFGLEPGQNSEVFRSDFGFHLLRVEEREEALARPLEEVREELAAELLRRDAALVAARDRAETLAAAVRGGQRLEDAAREAERSLERTSWLARRGEGFVPGLGPAPALIAEAFTLEPGASSPEVFEVASRQVLIQLLERREPEAEAIEAQLESKREELLEAKRRERADAWINARRNALIDSGELVVNLAALKL